MSDQITGFGAGAVVGDEDFAGNDRLVSEGSQAKLQRPEMVVGADDHGDFLWIDHTKRGSAFIIL